MFRPNVAIVERTVRRLEGLEDAETTQVSTQITALSEQLSPVKAQVSRISVRDYPTTNGCHPRITPGLGLGVGLGLGLAIEL